MNHSITIEGGSSVRLPTAGKYCDRDIVVTATDGGGGDSNFDALLDRTISGKVSSNAKSLPDYIFNNCKEMEGIDLPLATVAGTYVFQNNTALKSINAPLLTEFGMRGMYYCKSLEKAVFPSLVKAGTYCFASCVALEYIDLPVLSAITNSCFNACHSLKAVLLRSPSLCTLVNTSVFGGCHHIHGTKSSAYNPEGLKDGYIYVPRDLKNAYENATNWSAFIENFRALEDYTIDGTVTGELDPAKI